MTTSEDHRRTLINQLDDATSRDELHRKQVYLQLLIRIDNAGP